MEQKPIYKKPFKLHSNFVLDELDELDELEELDKNVNTNITFNTEVKITPYGDLQHQVVATLPKIPECKNTNCNKEELCSKCKSFMTNINKQLGTVQENLSNLSELTN